MYTERYFKLFNGEYDICCKAYIPVDWNVDGVILGVHGYKGSKESSTLREIAKAASKKHVALLTFDFPGHGESAMGIEINENHCNLWLHHFKDTDHGRAIDKSFDLISEEAPMLSAKEYAELHDYTEEQVLDWLNRGKFRKAFMRKGKWRIPAYGEPCRGFIDGVFFIHESLEYLPENLQYLDKYFRVATKTDDGKNLVLCMGGINDKDTGYRRIKEKRVVSNEEREQIEAIFAADEDVVCTYSSLYLDYFERY